MATKSIVLTRDILHKISDPYLFYPQLRGIHTRMVENGRSENWPYARFTDKDLNLKYCVIFVSSVTQELFPRGKIICILDNEQYFGCFVYLRQV